MKIVEPWELKAGSLLRPSLPGQWSTLNTPKLDSYGSMGTSSHFNIVHVCVCKYGSIWNPAARASAPISICNLAHLAPGCRHKVFGAASNVVYSYAGPRLTGVNHRGQHGPGDGMESDEDLRRNSEAAQTALRVPVELRLRSLVVL